MKIYMNSTLGENTISKIESRIQEMMKKCVYSLFTNNGKEKGGEKFLSLLGEHKEDMLNYKVNEKYRDITCEELCKFLESRPDVSYIDLDDESNKIAVHFLYYIWIHNWSFLSKINYETVSKSENDADGAYFIYTIFNAFTEFKNKLDGRDIEEMKDNERKGGSAEIRLTMYLVLLLITFASISAPGGSGKMDEATVSTMNKQIASIAKKGTEIGNDIGDQFVTFLDFAKEIPYAVRDVTVFSLKFYQYTGMNDFVESSTGLSLMNLLDYGLTTEQYLTTTKNRIERASIEKQNEIGKKLAKFLNINEKFAIESVHKSVNFGSTLVRIGIIHHAKKLGERMFKNKIKGSAIGVIAGTLISNIDQIVYLLQENKSSMYSGSSILYILQGFKNVKNKSLQFIHDKVSPDKKKTRYFDLNKEDNEVALFMNYNEDTTILKQLLDENMLLGGRKKRYTKKRYKRRSLRKH